MSLASRSREPLSAVGSSRRAILAAGLVLALLVPGQAATAAVAVAVESLAVTGATSRRDDAHHHCKCRERCRGASCCCGPREATAARSEPRPVGHASSSGNDASSSSSSKSSPGPCVASAPCGDPAMPVGAPAGPYGKATAMSAIDGSRFAAVVRFLSRASDSVLPSRRSSRLDRPPRRLATS